MGRYCFPSAKFLVEIDQMDVQFLVMDLRGISIHFELSFKLPAFDWPVNGPRTNQGPVS